MSKLSQELNVFQAATQLLHQRKTAMDKIGKTYRNSPTQANKELYDRAVIEYQSAERWCANAKANYDRSLK